MAGSDILIHGFTGGVGGGGSSLVQVSSQTVSSSVATVDFDGVFSATYQHYYLSVEGFTPATDGARLYMRLGTGSDPVTYQTTGYSARQDGGSAGNTVALVAATSTTSIPLQRDAAGWGLDNTASTGGLLCSAHIKNPYTSDLTFCVWQSTHKAANDPDILTIIGCGGYMTATTITSLRLLFNTGNITGGTATVYGYI